MRAGALDVLMIGVRPRSNANTIVDHLQAFAKFSRHRVHFLQNLTALYGNFGGRIPTLPPSFDLDRFDALVLHYSNFIVSERHLDADARERIRAFRGLKVLFLQDEYRQIDAIVARMRELGIDVLFTCVPEGEVEKVYPEERLPGVTKVVTLTGFVPDNLLEVRVPPAARRPIDVGYRSRKVPYWLGELGLEKWQIAPKFNAATRDSGLVLDCSYDEEDRIYGKAWARFLASCKTVLGVESGASVFDFTGDVQRRVDEHLARLPQTSFEVLRQRYFPELEGRISLNQISPRCFEAAALRTGMVLYEGRYSGILEPGRHYIALRKDFANIDEVVVAIKDHAGLQKMIDRTYEEVARNPAYSYRAFIEKFDAVVESQIAARGKRASGAAARHGRVARGVAQRLREMLVYALDRVCAAGFWVWTELVPPALREVVKPGLKKLLYRRAD
jgi:hypothetical protein